METAANARTTSADGAPGGRTRTLRRASLLLMPLVLLGACFRGDTAPPESTTPPKTPPATAPRAADRRDVMPLAAVTFSQLMKRGRALVMDRISEQSRQSLPVPLPSEGGAPPRIAFLYAPSQVRPGVNRLVPPSAVVFLDPTGALLEVRTVSPKDFGQAHEPSGLLGEFRLPPGMTANDYLVERERLFNLYDALFSAWAGGEAPGNRPELKGTAREYLRLFERLREPPLEPYYESLGAAWFDWVRATAG